MCRGGGSRDKLIEQTCPLETSTSGKSSQNSNAFSNEFSDNSDNTNSITSSNDSATQEAPEQLGTDAKSSEQVLEAPRADAPESGTCGGVDWALTPGTFLSTRKLTLSAAITPDPNYESGEFPNLGYDDVPPWCSSELWPSGFVKIENVKIEGSKPLKANSTFAGYGHPESEYEKRRSLFGLECKDDDYDYTYLKQIDLSRTSDISYLLPWGFDDVSVLESWAQYSESFSNIAGLFYNSSFDTFRGLENWNVSNVVNMEDLFEGNYEPTDLNYIASWDVSRVRNMKNMFSRISRDSDWNAIANWHTSSLKNMAWMFPDLASVDFLANWDVSQVEDMTGLFTADSLTNINALSRWNTANVKSMCKMFWGFEGLHNLSDVSGLSNWNVSNVENFSMMFSGCSKVADWSPLYGWNMASSTDVSDMFAHCINVDAARMFKSINSATLVNVEGLFEGCTNLSDISFLSDWNTKNIQNMRNLFKDCTNLKDFSALENWDLSGLQDQTEGAPTSNSEVTVSGMKGMFEGVSAEVIAFGPKWQVKSDMGLWEPSEGGYDGAWYSASGHPTQSSTAALLQDWSYDTKGGIWAVAANLLPGGGSADGAGVLPRTGDTLLAGFGSVLISAGLMLGLFAFTRRETF